MDLSSLPQMSPAGYHIAVQDLPWDRLLSARDPPSLLDYEHQVLVDMLSSLIEQSRADSLVVWCADDEVGLGRTHLDAGQGVEGHSHIRVTKLRNIS